MPYYESFAVSLGVIWNQVKIRSGGGQSGDTLRWAAVSECDTGAIPDGGAGRTITHPPYALLG